jgi:hypothetical protein
VSLWSHAFLCSGPRMDGHQWVLRGRKNLLAREGALYCSAMVQHCYATVGVDFCGGGVNLKNTTPQDIAGTAVPHTVYAVMRQPMAS